MDVLLSPLNLAHQEGRRAERLLESGKLGEAIECHRKVTEYLKQALEKTNCPEAAVSISLQHKQQNIREQLLIKQQKTLSHLASTAHSEKMAYAQNVTETDGKQSEPQYDMALRTIDECDSLLLFLERRSGDVSLAPSVHMAKLATLRPQGVKMPKEDKTIIEELRLINEALRFHIQDLLQESDGKDRLMENLRRDVYHYQQENSRLKARIEQLEKSNKLCDAPLKSSTDDYYPFPDDLKVEDLSSLELPPLEMPMFDFDSLKGMGVNQCSPPNKGK